MDWAVSYTNPQSEAAVAYFVNESSSCCEVLGVSEINRLDRSAESYFVGDRSDRLAQSDTITHRGAVNTGKAALFDFSSDVECLLTPAVYRSQLNRTHSH